MTGGGHKPKGGRLCLGSARPRTVDAKTAAAELVQATKQMEVSQQVQCFLLLTNQSWWRVGGCWQWEAGRVSTADGGFLMPWRPPGAQELGAARARLAEATASQQAGAKALREAEAALPKAALDCQASQQALADAQQRLAALRGSARVSPEPVPHLAAARPSCDLTRTALACRLTPGTLPERSSYRLTLLASVTPSRGSASRAPSCRPGRLPCRPGWTMWAAQRSGTSEMPLRACKRHACLLPSRAGLQCRG